MYFYHSLKLQTVVTCRRTVGEVGGAGYLFRIKGFSVFVKFKYRIETHPKVFWGIGGLRRVKRSHFSFLSIMKFWDIESLMETFTGSLLQPLSLLGSIVVSDVKQTLASN